MVHEDWLFKAWNPKDGNRTERWVTKAEADRLEAIYTREGWRVTIKHCPVPVK